MILPKTLPLLFAREFPVYTMMSYRQSWPPMTQSRPYSNNVSLLVHNGCCVAIICRKLTITQGCKIEPEHIIYFCFVYQSSRDFLWLYVYQPCDYWLERTTHTQQLGRVAGLLLSSVILEARTLVAIAVSVWQSVVVDSVAKRRTL